MVLVDKDVKQNNFDLLRLIFAVIVFLVHAAVLSTSTELDILQKILSSGIAVESFFIVSGFLIFMSFENSKSLMNYYSKRMRRIYPAYFTIIMFCSIVGVFFSTLPLAQYFSLEWLKYVLANLIFLNFLHQDLPGVFTLNNLNAVNGALWTLKVEMMFYVSVPIVVWMIRSFGRRPVLLSVYIASIAYSTGLNIMLGDSHPKLYGQLIVQLPAQMVYFIAGATCYYYFNHFTRYWKWLVPFAITVFIFKSSVDMTWLEPLALAILVMFFAYIVQCSRQFTQYGDFSYGIYIVHFPILQALISVGLFAYSPYLGLLASAVLVFILSYASWHLIEKPFLRKSSHYIREQGGAR